LDDVDKISAVKEFSDRLTEYSLVSVIRSMNNEYMLSAVKEFKGLLGEGSICVIIDRLDNRGENEELIKNILQESGICENLDVDTVAKYMNKLNTTILDGRNLLTEEAVDLLGEQEHYELFKYIVIPGDGDKLDITEALENPEKFKGYLQLRDNYKDKKLAVQNLANGIEEYSKHYELINSIMDEQEISLEQLAVLEQLTKDEPYEEIKTKEDLEKFPQLRKERYERLIENNSKEAAYEMLLGMSAKDYKKVEDTFSKDKRLSVELEGMFEKIPAEEQERIAEIISMLKVVELIEDMPEEQRKETLQSFNDDLAKEFEDGSRIAGIRDGMAGLRQDMRKLFGKELSQSLDVEINEETKKEIIHEEGKEDIEVVHMEGEEFKILIHAVDAYGSGNGHFENREIGNQYICTSLITDKFMGRAGGRPIVGFTNFGEEALIQEGSQDIYSYGEEGKKNNIDIGAYRGTGFRKSDDLVKETVKKGSRYNEVNLWREYMREDGQTEVLIPSYIVCFDEIDELSKQEARLIAEKFGLDKPLPILVINTEKYKDRIEEYAKEVREEAKEEAKEEIQQQVVEEKIEGKTLSERVEEIMQIAEEKAEPGEIAKVQLEMINAQEQTQERTQENQEYKKPTAMMSKDDGIER